MTFFFFRRQEYSLWLYLFSGMLVSVRVYVVYVCLFVWPAGRRQTDASYFKIIRTDLFDDQFTIIIYCNIIHFIFWVLCVFVCACRMPHCLSSSASFSPGRPQILYANTYVNNMYDCILWFNFGVLALYICSSHPSIWFALGWFGLMEKYGLHIHILL